MSLIRYFWNDCHLFVKVMIVLVAVVAVLIAVDISRDPCSKYDPQNRCLCIEFKAN